MTFTRRETIQGVGAGAAAIVLGGPVAVAASDDTPPAEPSPHMLWYRQPAEKWTEALPIGNGRLGGMVFGGTARERIQLNEGTLWAGAPYDPVNPLARETLARIRALVFAGRIAEAESLTDQALLGRPKGQMPYQGLGDLRLDFPLRGAVTGYRRMLDLDSAVATTRFTIDGADHVRQVIASPIDQVIAIHLTTSDPRGVDVDISFASPQAGATTRSDGRAGLVMTGGNGDREGIKGGLSFAARLSVQADGGTVAVPGDRLSVRGARAATLMIAMATSFRRFDDVSGDPEAMTAATIARARGRRFARIAGDATERHRMMFRRVAIDLARPLPPRSPPTYGSPRRRRGGTRRSPRCISNMRATC